MGSEYLFVMNKTLLYCILCYSTAFVAHICIWTILQATWFVKCEGTQINSKFLEFAFTRFIFGQFEKEKKRDLDDYWIIAHY